MNALTQEEGRINMSLKLPKLLVIRHGETQWNVAGRLQGHLDTPLTLNGVRQAMAVAAHLSETVEALGEVSHWVSPLGRARQTASILAGIWGRPFEAFVIAPMLAERRYGSWEGRTLDEIRQTMPDQFEARGLAPWTYAMPDGESPADLTQRLLTWLQGLNPDHAHVVVSHSGCLRALRGLYSQAAPEEVLAYREPQTTAFLLAPGEEIMLGVSASGLRAFGCEGEGRTVLI